MDSDAAETPCPDTNRRDDIWRETTASWVGPSLGDYFVITIQRSIVGWLRQMFVNVQAGERQRGR